MNLNLMTMIQIFTAWSETTLVRDETRALKRQVYSTVQGFGQYYLTTAQVQNTNATCTKLRREPRNEEETL